MSITPPEPQIGLSGPVVVTPIPPQPTAADAFRAASAQLLEDIERAQGALTGERLRLAERLEQCDREIDALARRHEAILDALRSLGEPSDA